MNAYINFSTHLSSWYLGTLSKVLSFHTDYLIKVSEALLLYFLGTSNLYFCCSVAKKCPTLCDPMGCKTPGFLVLHYLLESAQTHPLNQWCYPTIPSSVAPFSFRPQSFPASGSFPVESVLHIRWPKYWSFYFRISPSSEYPGLISFRMDWLDLLAVQGTLNSLLEPHSKSIDSSALTFLFGPTLTSIHDYWKNHSFD